MNSLDLYLKQVKRYLTSKLDIIVSKRNNYRDNYPLFQWNEQIELSQTKLR